MVNIQIEILFSMINKRTTVLSLLLGYVLQLSHAKEGISFVVVGDYGVMSDLTRANAVFDAISKMKEQAESGSAEDFDFFVTTGDNIYASDETNPSESELKLMMDLFTTRAPIADLQIYPVRGNHEGYWANENVLVNLKDSYPTWNMPSNFYEK